MLITVTSVFSVLDCRTWRVPASLTRARGPAGISMRDLMCGSFQSICFNTLRYVYVCFDLETTNCYVPI